ncbi:MFS transporter [Sphingomonas sp.]|uniref:MFS transporter n=1 Tax=Sphingomonas sp. TaxID=28214 RepID=UPI002DBC8F8E|nr:MFS transporter [Sphingomonas sp.]HEU4969219.1 MFS transporter [Sphingomonas sp.]
MTAERVPLSTKLSYGLGAVAYGIKDNGFSVFLLLFYNQVVGLPADQVGFAIMIALFVDAFVDPAIGSLSDRTHTRIGRRHPWLYGSALPIALSWVLLWNPPQAGTAATLGYLVVIAILVRAAISTNEVPSAAMVPELTRDYHERTAVIRYRYVFGWAGGLAMLMLAYGYLLRPPTGPTAGPGYHNFGVVGAIVMLVSVLASAIGTHKRLAHPPKARIESLSVGKEIRAILSTLGNRAFVLLISAGVFAYINQGIAFAMSNYLLGFVWLFRPVDFLTYSICLFAGVLLAFFIVTPVARAFGKRGGAAIMTLLSAAFGTTPYWLRLARIFPEPGDPQLLPILLTMVGLATGFGVCVMMLIGSMIADVVEAAEEQSGKREEGLFYAGGLFMQKCTSGLGIFASGILLSASGFPAKAVPGKVPVEVLDRLTTFVAGLTVLIALAASWLFTRFPISKADHEARLAKLAVASAESGGNP